MSMFIAAILGGAWRLFDGAAPKPSGWWPHGLVYRNDEGVQWTGYTAFRMVILALIVVGIMATQVDMLVWNSLPMWLWAAGIVRALQRGFGKIKEGPDQNDWNTFSPRQISQYFYAALPLPVIVYMYETTLTAPLIYCGLLVVAGLAHPVCSKFNVHTRWAEACVGACVVGGIKI